MTELNFFNSIENLEPKCPKCGVKIDYVVSTRFDDELECHVCECGHVFK